MHPFSNQDVIGAHRYIVFQLNRLQVGIGIVSGGDATLLRVDRRYYFIPNYLSVVV